MTLLQTYLGSIPNRPLGKTSLREASNSAKLPCRVRNKSKEEQEGPGQASRHMPQKPRRIMIGFLKLGIQVLSTSVFGEMRAGSAWQDIYFPQKSVQEDVHLRMVEPKPVRRESNDWCCGKINLLHKSS